MGSEGQSAGKKDPLTDGVLLSLETSLPEEIKFSKATSSVLHTEAVRAIVEFSSLWPATAVVMVLDIE
jgi:Holliday junction resolvase